MGQAEMFRMYSNVPELREYHARILGTGAAAPTKEYGPGMSFTRTSAGLYKVTFAGNPYNYVSMSAAFGAATPGALVDLKVIRDTYSFSANVASLELLIASPYLKGSVVSSNPASIAAGGVGTVTLTVAGVQANDIVLAHPRELADGLVVESYNASGVDTITCRLLNPTAGAIDDGAQTWEYLVFRSNPTDLAADQYADLTFRFKQSGV